MAVGAWEEKLQGDQLLVLEGTIPSPPRPPCNSLANSLIILMDIYSVCVAAWASMILPECWCPAWTQALGLGFHKSC